jgi:histidinol-phosphate aminotransferase
LAKVKDSYNCDSLSIAGATAAIDDRAWFDRTRSAILATRGRMASQLRALGFECVDSQANFVWCPRSEPPAEEMYRRLKRDGVLVRYMNYLGWGDGLRISVGTDVQIDLLLEKLAEML